ncbi:hypothetical protein [Chryseobacterium sp. FH1]|uniref:hypothetical protein n=1 Tax=Chryseobacterium sp. FH1 TaxID=1233951 RepID=UPI0004E2B69B|nr:hypothetical protein [Chryseobacterium sp. FH1]KFC18485.1 hypothetical protein IO90_18450 [Chryseobacterium sp. FH1]
MKKILAPFIPLVMVVFVLQACEKKVENSSKENSVQKNIDVEKKLTEFKSLLRPNENIELGKIYTDTVNFVDFMDYTDDYLFVVKKSKDTIHLIFNKDNPKFVRGNKLEIKWKMDSLRPAGDPDFLDYQEFLISSKKLSNEISKRDFSKVKNQSFVISCGTGCAMTHNIKKVEEINPKSIKVTFEIDTYIDQEQTETFDEIYTFYYDNAKILKKITREGEAENALDNFMGSAKQSFEEFAVKLAN